MGVLYGESIPGIWASASWEIAGRTTDATGLIQSQPGTHQHIVGVHGTECMHLLSTGAHDGACAPNIVAYADNFILYICLIFPVLLLLSDNTWAGPNKRTTDITEDYRNCSTSTSPENVYITGLRTTGIAVSIEYCITGTTSFRRALNYHWYHNTQRHAIS
jgi:hypothetical protein